MTDIIVTEPAPLGVLREVRIFCAASGENNGVFPTHVYGYRVIDADGKEVQSTIEEKTAHEEGNVNLGFHKCLLHWLKAWPTENTDGVVQRLRAGHLSAGDIAEELAAPRKLVIVAPPGDRIFDVYRVPVPTLVQRNFCKPDGKLYANAAYAAQVLAEAEEMGVTVDCRPPLDIQEVALLEQTHNEMKRHRRKVLAAESNGQ